jgi:hypothetical protein
VTLVLATLFIVAVSTLAQTPPLREQRRHDEMEDLAAVSLTLSPPYPVPSEATRIQLQIRNRAAMPALDVEVAFYAGRRVLAARTVSVDAQRQKTVTIPWKPSAAGAQTISALIDPHGRLTERDRSDNTITREVVVAPRPPHDSDLAVESIEFISAVDKPGILRVTITNSGTSRARAPLIVEREGAQIAAVLAGPVEPGGRTAIELPLSAADSASVRAEINPRFGRIERKIRDNARELVRPPGVDLQIADLGLQTAHLQAGQRRRVVVTFRIVNAGRDAIESPFATTVEPGVTDPDGKTHPFVVKTAALPGGASVYVSHTIESAPADFEVVVKTDAENAIAETDESNNEATKHFSNPAPDIDRWVLIGPSRIDDTQSQGYGWKSAIGRLSAIAIDPNVPSTMFVGSQSGGVWKTTDGAATWAPVADSATVWVAALALSPDDASRVFLVTPDDGVFRSDDAGTSWTQISKSDLNAIVHGGVLLIHPSRTNELLVASDDGVYLSTDGGGTWLLTLPGGPANGLIRLPGNPNVVLAAISHKTSSDTAGIYESFDDGATWRVITGCPGGALPADDKNTIIRIAASGRQLFASYRLNDPKKFRLLRTTATSCSIGGVLESSWETGWTPTGDVDGDPIPSVLWSGLWADPTNPKNLYLGGTHFWRSTNGGSSFSRTSGLDGTAHADHHNVVTDPQSPNVIYTLNDGGIYRSTNRGDSGSFQFVGDGIANVELYDHVAAPLSSNTLIGGAQDNGTLKADVASSTVWKEIRGDDGATVDIDSADPDVYYSMEQYADSIARSSNAGDSFSGAANGLPKPYKCFNLQFQVHSRKPATLLAACGDLWRSTNSGSSWSVLFTPPAGAIVQTAIDGPGDIYYAGSSTGVVFAGSAGAGFSGILPTAGMAVTDIEIDPDDRRTLYVSLGGGQAGRIMRLSRTSVAPLSFSSTDITSDLPTGRTVKTIAIDRNHPFTIYAGTDRGVFRGRSINFGKTWFWRPYVNGLPATVDVRDLEVHPGSGVMRAATFGRSAFEVNTDHPMGSVLAVEGRVTFLRVHNVGTGFGPPLESLDAEVIAQLDTAPGKSLGFQLRNDGNEQERRGMLDLLRNAFRRNEVIRIEYVRTSIHNGVIFRVVKIH